PRRPHRDEAPAVEAAGLTLAPDAPADLAEDHDPAPPPSSRLLLALASAPRVPFSSNATDRSAGRGDNCAARRSPYCLTAALPESTAWRTEALVPRIAAAK